MKAKLSAWLAVVTTISLIACSSASSVSPNELRSFPLDSLEGIITQAGVQLDKLVSSDGNGSLRIETTESVVVNLFEIRDIEIDNTQLIYRARLKLEGVTEGVYLEMWCRFHGRGEYSILRLDQPLTGTTDWVTKETAFPIKPGERLESIKLNLAINGQGRVWIDEIKLLKEALKEAN